MSASPSPEQPTPPASPTPASPRPSQGLSLPPSTGKPTPAAGERTLTGQVEEGVARGCLILHATGGGTYQLIGGDPTIVVAGARVSVTGHVVTGVMSYCMQGQPFKISEAHRL
jgi:hypothetical protein